MKRRVFAIVAVIVLVAVLCTVFVACNNSKESSIDISNESASTIVNRLARAGYDVSIIGEEDVLEAYAGVLECGELQFMVYGTKERTDDAVTVYCLKNISDVNGLYESMQYSMNIARENYQSSGQSYNYDLYRTGNSVIYGTTDGVRAAKG